MTPAFLSSLKTISPIKEPRAHIAITAMLIPIATSGSLPIKAVTASPSSPLKV